MTGTREAGAGPGPGPVFAYLLLTHKEPAHVEELVDRLLDLSPAGQVVVHHDLAAGPEPWAGRPPARVHRVERRPVLWGDWSIVDVTLSMIAVALEQVNAQWLVVLSGEHRPVTDLATWERATWDSGADALVDDRPLPGRLRFGRADEDANRFLARCAHRWSALDEPAHPLGQRAMGGAWKLSRYGAPLGAIEYSHRRRSWFIGTPRPRGPLTGATFYKGSQWMALNRRAAEAVVGVEAPVTDWFRRCHIADETYVHTVLRRHPGLDVRQQLVTFVPDGPARPGPTRWMVLALEDLPAVWASGAAFARKVDPVERPEVISAIDAEVDRRRARPPEASAASGTAGP
jgi:hypothetical protein